MQAFSRSLAAALMLVALGAQAQLRVEHAWVRSTVAQQTATGAFMTLTSEHGGHLVGASSPIAAAVDVHEMKMSGDTMQMRRIDALPLPAGRPVELKPGAYHLMLTGLRQQVHTGDVVPLRLFFEDAAGQRQAVDVKAPARLMP